jgi:hypothetical protein
MHISQNEQGQTLVQLSKEEWEDYGNQAGYSTTDASVKQASATQASANNSDLTKIASLHEDIKFHQKEIQTKMAQVAQILEGQEVDVEEVEETSNEAETKGSLEFNEDNYPNLVKQQEQEGLIGAFVPRV